jgi:hypothetical protein
MTRIAYRACPKCGAEVLFDRISAKSDENENVLFVRYDPHYKKIVLINAESGLKQEVNLSGPEQSPKPASRQIGGIIGPY